MGSKQSGGRWTAQGNTPFNSIMKLAMAGVAIVGDANEMRGRELSAPAHPCWCVALRRRLLQEKTRVTLND